jgi:hypothetical protein
MPDLEPEAPLEQGVKIVTTLQTDEDENLILDFPSELLDVLGWKEGDSLSIEAFAGRIFLRKL